MSTTIIKAVQACTPGSATIFDPVAIEQFCQFNNIDSLLEVSAVASNYLATQDVKKSATVSTFGCFVNEFFPHLTNCCELLSLFLYPLLIVSESTVAWEK